MVHQVVERLTTDGHAQVVHRREVRGAQSAGEVLLREVNLFGRTRRRPPLPHPPLQRPQTRLEATRILGLQPLEQRLGLQHRFLFQPGRHFLPHAIERIRARPPVAWPLHLAGQHSHISVPPCRFAIHAGLARRRRQRLPRLQESEQTPNLTIHDLGHRKLLFAGACDSVRMSSAAAISDATGDL